MKPFEGVNILDFTWIGTGPLSVNYLNYYGATTIKVESTLRPDPFRFSTPYKGGKISPETSYGFHHVHATKSMDITLNMKNPRAKDIAVMLIKWADVVFESFTPGAMEGWGLGYEELKKIKPEIIMVRTCMHGQTGPLSRQPGLGFMLTAISGLAPLTGWPDRPPSGQYFAFTDFVAPLFNAFCLMAALDYRRRTGRGQMLDMAQHESVLRCVGPLLLDAAVNQREYKATGNRNECAAPHGIYRCNGEDRWCAIAVFTDDEWKRFCNVVKNPVLAESSKFRTLLDRKKNEDDLDRIIEEWTIRRSAEEVMDMLQGAGVAAGIASNSGDIYDNPQVRHYQGIEELEHPEMGKTRIYLRPGFTLSDASFERSRPPLLGEHNELVYVKMLGIPDDEFVQMMAEGVFD